MKILVLFAHPALEKSRVNKQLIKEYKLKDNVTFHDLYQAYPDFDIDIKKEQDLLLTHDIVLLHHPFYWYSIPALLKEWIDLVLEHGWAYGSEGNQLRNKYILQVISTGGKAESYSKDGFVGVTMGELLLPLKKTFKLCKMKYLAPFIVHGTHLIQPEEVEQNKIELNQFIRALANDNINLNKVENIDQINLNLEKIITVSKESNNA